MKKGHPNPPTSTSAGAGAGRSKDRSGFSSLQYIDEPLPNEPLSLAMQRSPIRSIMFPPQSPLSISKQQARFDKFLDHMESLSVAASAGGPVFVLHPHPESGLGNNIRSLMTIFFLAIASDRGVRGESVRNRSLSSQF